MKPIFTAALRTTKVYMSFFDVSVATSRQSDVSMTRFSARDQRAADNDEEDDNGSTETSVCT